MYKEQLTAEIDTTYVNLAMGIMKQYVVIAVTKDRERKTREINVYRQFG